MYEVKWMGAHANTFEPRADYLVGWESEMKLIDESFANRALAITVNVAADTLLSLF